MGHADVEGAEFTNANMSNAFLDKYGNLIQEQINKAVYETKNYPPHLSEDLELPFPMDEQVER